MDEPAKNVTTETNGQCLQIQNLEIKSKDNTKESSLESAII